MGDLPRDRGGHHLQDECEGAGLLDRLRVCAQRLRAISASLHARPTQGVLGLRGVAQVGAHGNSSGDQGGNNVRSLLAPLELDGMRPRLHEAGCGRKRVLWSVFIGAER